ncbi:unnamed protein product [Eruca vesicaria subsp. sativa]|uniref:NAD-dependent epimerase/dehydratase domain-containing protein n=1 Tax=Eruca vesicaria subsp. sativa TaxID=29727 RepID=A0ABC8KQQ5_ERUVS|nr:unnamed protein product [Eruca vesicaria subsp. sativa]
MSGEEEKTICVTGASGYIASLIVKLLHLRGYTVKASVRDPNDPRKTEHFLALEGAKERLQLFKANLLEEGSFDSAIDGCEGVFHTASPFYHDVKDPQAELLDPAVKGTINVLSTCLKTPSVKRVVLTSSIASVAFNGMPRTPETLWYVLSKTLAENAAWEFAKGNNLQLVSINAASIGLIQTITKLEHFTFSGAQTYPNATFGWVNVKDVANAHIQAFDNPEANGRYCLVERVAHFSEVVNILHDFYPDFLLPEKCADEKIYIPIYKVSKEKAESLGVEFVPLEVSIKETVESLQDKGFIRF